MRATERLIARRRRLEKSRGLVANVLFLPEMVGFRAIVLSGFTEIQKSVGKSAPYNSDTYIQFAV